MAPMHDITQLQGLVHYQTWRRKEQQLIRVMVTKSFDHLLSKFNSLNILSEGIYVISFPSLWRG